jgi:Divergent InlB B-repeat domain
VNVRIRLLATVSALLGLLAVSGASAAMQPQVPLTLSITGRGTVRLSDGHRLSCSSRCHKTFSVRTGTKVNLTARPGSGWVFAKWNEACRGAKPTCGLRLRHAAGVAAIFGAPGSTSANPIPLGHGVKFKDGWVVRVVSTTIDATAEILAISGNSPPAPGAQYAMLNLAATYAGAGASALGENRFEVIGSQNYCYDYCYQGLPAPVLALYANVYSGQTVGGNICYEIASEDADVVQLRAYAGSGAYVWFALR